MEKDRNKKKTLTISGSFNKKLKTDSYSSNKKKSFLIEKKKSNFKKPFKSTRPWPSQPGVKGKPNNRNFNRKFAEQQATKRFIHSDKKDSEKGKIKSLKKSRGISNQKTIKINNFQSNGC